MNELRDEDDMLGSPLGVWILTLAHAMKVDAEMRYNIDASTILESHLKKKKASDKQEEDEIPSELDALCEAYKKKKKRRRQ